MYYREFEIKDGILSIHLSGEFPVKILKSNENIFTPLAEACILNCCKRALLDVRKLENTFSVVDVYKLGKDIAMLSLQQIKVAFLIRQELYDHFFEDEALNRGAHVQLFTDLNSATEWLKKCSN
jgi:hypothetical protein